jgi:hypothetical protein
MEINIYSRLTFNKLFSKTARSRRILNFITEHDVISNNFKTKAHTNITITVKVSALSGNEKSILFVNSFSDLKTLLARVFYTYEPQ